MLGLAVKVALSLFVSLGLTAFMGKLARHKMGLIFVAFLAALWLGSYGLDHAWIGWRHEQPQPAWASMVAMTAILSLFVLLARTMWARRDRPSKAERAHA